MRSSSITLKGVTRIPDDSACENGQLSMAMNLAADGGGLRLLEKPTDIFALNEGETTLGIHKNNGYFHYLLRGSNGHLLYVNAAQDGTVTATTRVDTNITIAATTKISVIGNTLCLYGGTVSYILWRENDPTPAYHNLGERPPRLMLRFALSDAKMECSPQGNSNAKWTWKGSSQDVPIQNVGGDEEGNVYSKEWAVINHYVSEFEDRTAVLNLNLEDMIGTSDTSEAKITEFVDGMTTLALARANKMLADAHHDNRFVMPFFVRYGYRLFDDSVIMHSDPILMIPNLKSPVFLVNSMRVKPRDSTANRYVEINGKAWAMTTKLEVTRLNTPDLTEWKDLIKSVGIYVSEPLYTYDQDGKVWGWEYCRNFTPTEQDWLPYYDEDTEPRCWGDRWGITNRVTDDAQTTEPTAWKKRPMKDEIQVVRDNNDFPFIRLLMPDKTEKRMREEISKCANFYLLGEIPFDEVNTFTDIYDYLEDGTLNTITQRRKMPDDNYTRDTTSANVAYAYNNRLHLAEPSRQLAPPMPVGSSWTWRRNTTELTKYSYWDIAVQTDKGTLVTEASEPDDVIDDVSINDGPPLFLFYPNTNAHYIWLQAHDINGLVTSTRLFKFALNEHETLNGAYWLADLWGSDPSALVTGTFPTPTTGGVKDEQPHTVISSNALNPFYFEAGNYCETGDGEVLALAVATEAMSEGQFGQHPLYVFTTDGVKALQVGDNGKFVAVHTITRDIIKAGTQPLNLDKSVLFITKRGILRMAGASVAPFTTALWNGFDATSVKRLSDICELAGVEDNVNDISDCDRMVYDYQHQRIYISDNAFSWVYNINTGLWTQAETAISATLNSYPQTIYVDNGIVKSLDTEQHYDHALIVTRPIKLGDFAKIRQLAVRGLLDPQGNDVNTVICGSRKWSDYLILRSSNRPTIHAHGGSPMRSHVIAVTFNGAKSVHGLDIIFDNEQFNVLR